MDLYHLFFLININKSSSSQDNFSWFFLFLDICRIKKFFSRFWFSLKSQVGSDQSCAEIKKNEKRDDINIKREEIEMVMENLGLFRSEETEKLKDSMSFDELSDMFGEKEPSFDEVKDVFNVFDDNKDGFIDAYDLQRLLCRLGFKEANDIKNCKNMVSAFDENKDGKIDFDEFGKFMEKLLS